jgi:digeranylgeranylglycerophospholipid reductase
VHYDVVIVGGRIAGNTTAIYAAQAGLRVLVLDNSRTVGCPVQCGEFLPDVDEHFPAYRRYYADVPIPATLVRQRTEWIRVFSPGGRNHLFPFGGCTLNRDALDTYLSSRAKELGAEVRACTTVLAFDKNTVLTESGCFEANVIVIASGPGAKIPRLAGFSAPSKLNPAIFCVAEGPFVSNTIDIYFGDAAPGGYAWIIPKGDAANIGLGFPRAYRQTNMRALLSQFLSRFPKMKVRYVSGGHIPLGGRVKTLVSGQRLLVGDAAGMVMASNGGGNLPALIAGQLAGIAIADHLLQGQPLTKYEQSIDMVMGTELEVARRRKLIFDVLYRHALRHDLIFEGFFRLGGSLLIEKAIRISPLIEHGRPWLPMWARNYANARL